MRFFVLSLIVIFNLVFQTTLFQHIEIFGVIPNTAILIVISYAVIRGDVEGALLGFTIGLFQDMFYGQVIGRYALMLALAGYICGKPFKDFFKETYTIPLVLTFTCTIIYGMIIYVTDFLLFASTDISYYFTKIIFPETIYTTVLTVFIYKFIYWINCRIEAFENRRKEIF